MADLLDAFPQRVGAAAGADRPAADAATARPGERGRAVLHGSLGSSAAEGDGGADRHRAPRHHDLTGASWPLRDFRDVDRRGRRGLGGRGGPCPARLHRPVRSTRLPPGYPVALRARGLRPGRADRARRCRSALSARLSGWGHVAEGGGHRRHGGRARSRPARGQSTAARVRDDPPGRRAGRSHHARADGAGGLREPGPAGRHDGPGRHRELAAPDDHPSGDCRRCRAPHSGAVGRPARGQPRCAPLASGGGEGPGRGGRAVLHRPEPRGSARDRRRRSHRRSLREAREWAGGAGRRRRRRGCEGCAGSGQRGDRREGAPALARPDPGRGRRRRPGGPARRGVPPGGDGWGDDGGACRRRLDPARGDAGPGGSRSRPPARPRPLRLALERRRPPPPSPGQSRSEHSTSPIIVSPSPTAA